MEPFTDQIVRLLYSLIIGFLVYKVMRLSGKLTLANESLKRDKASKESILEHMESALDKVIVDNRELRKIIADKEAPAEKPLRGDLIKLVSSGKAYVNYGKGKYGTLEQLREILRECFPEDASIAHGVCENYRASHINKWVWEGHSDDWCDDHVLHLQQISLSEFFQQASGSAPSEAFQEGQKAWNLFNNEGKQVKNPYPKFKEDYAEWRRGFNVGISDVNVD